ncbi:hypothetical protein O3597_22255 [Verrucosispora sp. WMMA2044]|uniref:Uncharacterized protein n=1 Tax=Verrucosispora sioxanthis TaxID=2499994 RepID=A0A6M1L2B5_9ACTN|nr:MULTISPECIES: hypothetical protein [Micromonospora]NEE63327.1 hypothetical protein [Verrucosispora sioxanthis]NGM12437.1 hypothetical protein [Verrucosispora sioxanthis]WBB47817.1 hypothetical protein O3597_22255 [Verrucosispora sp. WMMA2044]
MAAFDGRGGQVPVVAVAVACHRALTDVQDRVGDPAEELPVMGDREQCAAVLPQARLKPAHGLITEVVGRLVEQEQFRLCP